MGADTAQLEFFEGPDAPYDRGCGPLHDELRNFDAFGKRTVVQRERFGDVDLPVYVNEFWTSRQRQASRLHEVSYRACFKPQLPAFFVERLTQPDDLVHDPFMGRGTTLVESALRGRRVAGCDINPLSKVLVAPRLSPPSLQDVAARLDELKSNSSAGDAALPEDLLVFYHPKTLREILALRSYLLDQEHLAPVDAWIRMVATNRLTGHSPGFFSVYTMPPNQAVSAQAQRKINEKRKQKPDYRDVSALILRKSKALLGHETIAAASAAPTLLTGAAANTPQLADNTVSLVVTSPPFLDIVQYAADNWLRCWFNGIDADAVQIPMHRKVEDWQAAMTEVFLELRRVLRPGGHVAFEVGEVRGGKVRLEEAVVPCAIEAKLEPQLVLINDQKFTKTANCWGVSNNRKGTNTNRVVLLRK